MTEHKTTHLPLRPRDVERLAAEYDAAPPMDEGCRGLWDEYAAHALDLQASLAEEYTIYLVPEELPYSHGRLLLADLVVAEYRVPAPRAVEHLHPCWDGAVYSASRTVHDLTGHGYAGSYFDLEGELLTVTEQAAWTPEHLMPVVFSDTVQQLCSTLTNHRFAPQKVLLTEHERAYQRVMDWS